MSELKEVYNPKLDPYFSVAIECRPIRITRSSSSSLAKARDLKLNSR